MLDGLLQQIHSLVLSHQGLVVRPPSRQDLLELMLRVAAPQKTPLAQVIVLALLAMKTLPADRLFSYALVAKELLG